MLIEVKSRAALEKIGLQQFEKSLELREVLHHFGLDDDLTIGVSPRVKRFLSIDNLIKY